jgi:hypothetical protein
MLTPPIPVADHLSGRRFAGQVVACLWLASVAAAAGQEPSAVPAPDAAPMYVPDTAGGAGFAAVPTGVAADMLPSWPRWFGGASGLVMTRTLPPGAATMRPVGGLQLTTADAGATWPGGIDLRLGRWFGDRQQHAVELIYWGIFNLGSAASVTTSPPAIDAIPQAPGATIGGTAAAAFLDNAAGQQIARADVINDVEINWVYSLWERPEFLPHDRGINLMWLAGFRFFEVNDILTLTSTPGSGGLTPAEIAVATNNNIYGAQVGAKFDWLFLPRLRFNVVPKFMIGGNSITNTTSLASATGTTALFADGTAARVHSTLGVFSWLGSVDTGLAWDVTDRWSLMLGYRVVGVGNIAQADGQWPTLLASPGTLPGLSAGSSTIVHGGFAGFEGRW